jgi:hypothetical protein
MLLVRPGLQLSAQSSDTVAKLTLHYETPYAWKYYSLHLSLCLVHVSTYARKIRSSAKKKLPTFFWYDTDRIDRLQQFFFCRGKFFTKLLLSKDRRIHSPTHRHTRPVILLLLRILFVSGTWSPSRWLAMKEGYIQGDSGEVTATYGAAHFWRHFEQKVSYKPGPYTQYLQSYVRNWNFSKFQF